MDKVATGARGTARSSRHFMCVDTPNLFGRTMLAPLPCGAFAAAIFVLLSTFPASADPGGGDASGDWRAPMDLSPGTYQGEIGGDDHDDWYRLIASEGKNIRVEIVFADPHAHVHLALKPDTGSYPWTGHVTWPQVHEVKGPAALLGLDSWTSGAEAYTITFTEIDAPDVATHTVRVTAAPIETDAGPVGTGTVREIEVDVANVGAGAGQGRIVLTAQTASDGATRAIGELPVSLAAGETRTVSLRWNTVDTGSVGDVTVVATAQFPMDGNAENDVARTTAYSVVGGTGMGVTSWMRSGTCAYHYVYACAFAQVDPRATGAEQVVRVLIPYEFAYAYAGLDGVRAGAGGGALVGARVDVVHALGPGGYVWACAVLCVPVMLP